MFDPARGHASTNGYPRDISQWGIPDNIDGAFLHSNGKTYFFEDDSINIFFFFQGMVFGGGRVNVNKEMGHMCLSLFSQPNIRDYMEDL